MLIFNELNAECPLPVSGELRLSYEWRQKSRFLAALVSGPQAGDEIGVRIARGQVLQDGDLLACRPIADSHIVQIICVRAAAEQLLQVTAATTLQLTRIAYHLGNRHVPVQVGQGGESQAQQLWLRLQLDHVLENMVAGLGGTVQILSAPFEPESGAYGQSLGSSHNADHKHSSDSEHSHDRAHKHEHEQGRDNGGQAASRHDDRRHAPKIHDFLK